MLQSAILVQVIAALLLSTALTPASPCGVPASVVQDPVEEPTVGQLMAGLRKRGVAWHERDRLVSELLDRGSEGAKPLAKYAVDRLKKSAADWDKSAKRYQKDFAKAAEDAIQERMPRGAEEEIETLRKESLAVTRGAELTKKQIAEEIDPRVKRLRELLRITPREVLNSDEGLEADREELVEIADLAATWWQVWEDAAEELAADEDGGGASALRRIKPPTAVAGRMDVLEAAEEWLAVLATPMTERDRRALEQNRALDPAIPFQEYDGVLYHNLIRIELGLHAQVIDPKLCDAGRGHSEDMKTLGFFAHESPVEGKKTPGDRAARAGTTGGAENIAFGQNSGRAAVNAWWYSPGHHKNMLSGASRIGLGQFESHWTEMFG